MPHKNDIIVGKNVKNIRDEKRIYIREVAAKMVTTNQTIINIQNGKKHLNYEEVEQIAEALEVKPADIMKGVKY